MSETVPLLWQCSKNPQGVLLTEKASCTMAIPAPRLSLFEVIQKPSLQTLSAALSLPSGLGPLLSLLS